MTQLPLSVDDLAMWALEYTLRLLGRGYTVAQAEREIARGYGCEDEPGYEIRKGILCVGWWTKDKKSAQRFRFADLVAKIEILRGATAGHSQQVLL